jgi:hypothetical protein
MSIYNYAILAAGTALWARPFSLARTKQDRADIVDRRARFGALLLGVGYTLLWQGSLWTRSPGHSATLAAVFCFAAACSLSWTAAPALGRHLDCAGKRNYGHHEKKGEEGSHGGLSLSFDRNPLLVSAEHAQYGRL